MTCDELSNYQDLAARLKFLTHTEVTDTVNGSSEDYPYTQHPVTLHGVAHDDKTLSEVKLLHEKLNALDAYIDSITDVRAHDLMDRHYRHGETWKFIAECVGHSEQANKKYLQRYFKNVST
jgi:hypothetical protein